MKFREETPQKIAEKLRDISRRNPWDFEEKLREISQRNAAKSRDR